MTSTPVRRRSTVSVVRGHEERVSRVFYEHDADGSGRLSRSQLRSALAALGALEEEGCDKFIDMLLSRAAVDYEGHVDGELTLLEFRSLFYAQRLKMVFDGIANASGLITEKELVFAFREVMAISEFEAKRMVELLGGRVDFEEFFRRFEFVPAVDLKRIAERWHHPSCEDYAIQVPPGLTMAQTVVVGGVSSIAARTVTAPFERLKIEAQTSSSPPGLIAEARRIARNEGPFRGLFLGHLLNCLRVFPNGAIGCSVFVGLLRREPQSTLSNPNLHELWRVSCAVASSTFVTTLTYPIDSLRTRWTVIGGGSESTFYVSPKTVGELFRLIIREEGFASLFRGLAPALYAVAPFVAVQQAAVDFARTYTVKHRMCDGENHNPALLVFVGAFAGVCAQTLAYPFEVVRRRMQLGASQTVATADPVPTRTWPALRQIVREQGVRGLYHGILPTYMMVVPSCAAGYAIALTMFDFFKTRNHVGEVGGRPPDLVAPPPL
ncbi:hypothetical protein CTAYLR_010187 [Chrysophaeum taylorii]|uniref:EF-hand domain-containing protein n=1 Tax=Chrysophaeum taylorii TaxID=2483200 RepID=A0AAD7U5P6_9STRA|nr:hypothetical protein CTAYLR_010187 [Chrysophaeum taylorii]